MRQFNDLYKGYQSEMLKTFNECIGKKGWKITKAWHSPASSNDIACLHAEIKEELLAQGGEVSFQHMWLDFLFIDRDEKPRRIDLNILNQHYGSNKIKYVVSTRVELIEAVMNKDEEKLRHLGKNLDRLLFRDSEGKVQIHYEWGTDITKLNSN